MTVKEFYEYCVMHGAENYTLDCYEVSPYGDVNCRTEVKEKDIHIKEGYGDTVIICSYS